MAKSRVMYKATPYTSKNVEIFMTESLVRFLRLTNQHLFMKEMLVAMQKADVLVMNTAKSEIQSMNAVYSGFLRNNLVSWIDKISNNAIDKPIVSYLGTRAWYDILVHKGLGIHANPRQKIPAQYMPTMEQLAIVPSFKEKLAAVGVKHSKTSGPRPFYTNALKKAFPKINIIFGDGYLKGLRNMIGHDKNIPRHKFSEVFSTLSIES